MSSTIVDQPSNNNNEDCQNAQDDICCFHCTEDEKEVKNMLKSIPTIIKKKPHHSYKKLQNLQNSGTKQTAAMIQAVW